MKLPRGYHCRNRLWLNWVRSFKTEKLGEIGKHYKTLSDTVELARLRRELAEVKDGAKYNKKGGGVLREGFTARYAMIEELRGHYPIPALCRQFKVSLSGYYRWQNASPSTWQREEARFEIEISAAHKRTRETYGTERLQEDIAFHGVEVGIHRIKRVRAPSWVSKVQAEEDIQSNHQLEAQSAGGRQSS